MTGLDCRSSCGEFDPRQERHREFTLKEFRQQYQREEVVMFQNCPALVLNADFQPLSYFHSACSAGRTPSRLSSRDLTSSSLNTTRSPGARRFR